MLHAEAEGEISMGKDPEESIKRVTRDWPPSRGPGSGKEAWISFASETAHSNEALWRLLDEQSNTIAYLETEVAQLRAKLAERKPKRGRPPLADHKVAAIRADLAAGFTQGKAAERNGVARMTVWRLVKSSQANNQSGSLWSST
jgi:hypothetical protein